MDGTTGEETHMGQDIFRGEDTNKVDQVDQFDQFFFKFVSFIYIATLAYFFCGNNKLVTNSFDQY